MNRFMWAVGLTVAAATLPALAADDAAMLKLASTSGCMACHQVEPGGKGPNGGPPIGPAWRDVAGKYKGEKDAQDRLTRTVLVGSNPYTSHWQGKVSGIGMPPNEVAIREPEARSLVRWILALEAPKR